ncbi:DUF2235 domain-containing protein [Trinickia acidisoli]|uniref:DUF2235 domain-containing protein n=1 Tax=Trinickia acidisoli TaxID=2767482 RepID=UPI001A8E99F5|nr:DUF2235 domain-containing protein [Trinickia acidisoli]
MSVVKVLSAQEISRVCQQASVIAASGNPATGADQFVFFAAFDGTNNDKNNVALSGNPQDTNVAQLFAQAERSARGDSNMGVGYYPGPGTRGSRTGSSWLPAQVTGQAIAAANKAYGDFCAQAAAWLGHHPHGTVTAMMTSFSRGGASAAIFSQLLWERGLVDPNNGKVLIPPGKVGVSAGLIYDPVDTGVNGNLAFAPNVRNITVVHALDERRTEFRGADYFGQPGVTVLPYTGNHCDIGGGYDNGLGALSLEAGTEFLRNSGMSIADVAESRRFDPTKPVVIHTEGVDDHGHRVWTEDAKFGYGVPRLNEKVVTASMMQEEGPSGETTRFTDFSGASVELTTRADGGYTERTVTHDGHMTETSNQTATTVQPNNARNAVRSTESSDFNIYGLDGSGAIHPSLLNSVEGANDQYVDQWLAERGYGLPVLSQMKNAG